MSNALALAGVTAVIKDLLDTGIIEHQITDAMGQGVTVTAVAPDLVPLTGSDALPRLNLFLHQVTPNQGWRNVNLPSRDERGRRASNPPLALDLHYLLTAYGMSDLQAEILLGYGMQLLHETPVIPRSSIRTALDPAPVAGSILPSMYHLLRFSDLADQVELIKITLASTNAEEMSRLWAALQAHYRPTAMYHVSVVLIESQLPARSALPVLSRGPVDPVTGRERGVVVSPDLLPPFPTIESVIPAGRQPAAAPGATVDISGHHLDGTNRALRLTNERLAISTDVMATSDGGYTSMRVVLPAGAAALPTGVYTAAANLLPPSETVNRLSNALPLVLAPEITTALPMTLARAADNSISVTLAVSPQVRQGQRISLLLGARETPADPPTAPTSTFTFVVPNAQPGSHYVRVRVDGVESPLIDRSGIPPTFYDRRIIVT